MGDYNPGKSGVGKALPGRRGRKGGCRLIRALFDESFLDQALGKQQPAAGEPGPPAELAVRLVRAARRPPSKQLRRAHPAGGPLRTALEHLGFKVRRTRTRCPGSEICWLSSRDGTRLALAVCCRPGRSLDRADPSDMENPRLVPELRAVRLAERLRAPWVILTNGLSWRLYRRGSDGEQLSTVQVDLGRAVRARQAGADRDLRRWQAVFGRMWVQHSSGGDLCAS